MAADLFFEARKDKKTGDIEVSGTYHDSSFRGLISTEVIDTIIDSFVRAIQKRILGQPGAFAQAMSSIKQFTTPSPMDQKKAS